MPNWSRLILPVGFGVLAAVVNWVAMSRHVEPNDFVVLRENVPMGSVISEGHITKLSSNLQVDQLAKVVVPWRERHLVVGRIATRNMVAGEPILVREFNPNKVDFRAVDRIEGNVLVTFVAKPEHLQSPTLMPGDYIRILLKQAGVPAETDKLFLQHIARTSTEVSLSVFMRADDPRLTQLGRALREENNTVIMGIYKYKD
ncbi:MAG: hypothetical protein AB8G99_26815 [Planctomycetaceae bacterium]